MFSIFILLFGVKLVYGIENDTCQCCAKLEALKEKDQALENRIAYLENLLGVVRIQPGDTEYVLVTAGGDPRDGSAKFSVIDMKSPSFDCEIKIDMKDYEGRFAHGAGGVLDNDTVIICAMDSEQGSNFPKCIKLAKDSRIWVSLYKIRQNILQ